MDLQISVFLLVLLFTAGHSLECYKCNRQTGSCADQTAQTCPGGSVWCETVAEIKQIGDITSKMMAKACATDCRSGSANHGYRRTISSCCNTDLCNRQDPPDPVPNGKQCYTCDDKSCSKTLSCSGDEDLCFTVTGNSEGQLLMEKGCVSKSFCDDTSSVNNVEGTTCCEGNLCNGSQSVSQSFLFLGCSLLSFFLMH